MHLNICDDELRHLVCCWVSADLLANHNWRLLLVWLLCLLSSFGTGRIFATDIFVGVFPDEAQQLVFCKEPQKSSPAALSHFSQKKKNPIVSNNQRKGKPVSEPSQIVLLHPSFLVSRFIIILWLAWAISVTIYLGNHYKNRCRTSVFVLYTALASLFYSFLLALRPHSAAAIFEDWSGDNNKQFNRGLCDPSEQLHEFANHSEYWLLGFFTVLPFQTSLVNEQSGRRQVGGNLKFSTQASGVE